MSSEVLYIPWCSLDISVTFLLQVVGKHRGRGATIDDVLDGVNALNKSNKKDEYVSR